MVKSIGGILIAVAIICVLVLMLAYHASSNIDSKIPNFANNLFDFFGHNDKNSLNNTMGYSLIAAAFSGAIGGFFIKYK